MATMMPPPVFNIPPPISGAPPSFRSGPPLGIPPMMFNPNMPPPNLNPGNFSSMAASRSSDSGTTNQMRTSVVIGPNPTTVLPAFLTRSHKFKPPATVNLAEAEGYGRRLRRNMTQIRRHIDGVASVLNYLEDRVWQSGQVWDQRALQPHMLYAMEATPPSCALDKPVDCVTTKFVRSAMNKVKCPIYDICWTPEGRRLVTGASSGEFTLWNGTAFNFETILQAHDTAIRAIEWSHNDLWMLSADHDGYIKYWQTNMNNVTMFQAHKEAIRSVSFCPSDVKFATASDDGTVRVWDFIRCREEHILRGHGSDVRCVDWHPRKGLLVSGSRDSQQPVKLWDPRTGHCLATLHDHKNAVMAAQWNDNGNWLVTGSRDHMVKLYDIRMMKEMITFRGHKKEVTSLAWHPVHEGLLVSGGADGALMFWSVTNDKEIGIVENAHEQAIWTLKWHPLGHILASGSNDNNTKFWARNKPGDTLEDFYLVTGNLYDQMTAQKTQMAGAVPATAQQPPSDKQAWEIASANVAAAISTIATTPTVSTPTTSSTAVIDSRKPLGSIIPGMGLEGEILEKLREQQQFAAISTSLGVQFPQTTQEPGGIPGLGGVTSDSDALGGRKTLLKQPPPKKAQRQFERVWNVSSQLQGGMMGPSADESGPPITADSTDYRKPKPSLLGMGPPEMDVPPQQQPPLLNSNPMSGPPGPSLLGVPGIQQQPQQPLPAGVSWMDRENWQQSPQQQPFPQQRHGQLQSVPGSSNFLLPTPDMADNGRGGGQWSYGGGRDQPEYGDVDLRHFGGGWGGGVSQFDEQDYSDPANVNMGGFQRNTAVRDPRMLPRPQDQQQQQMQQQHEQLDYRFQNWVEPANANLEPNMRERRAPLAPPPQSHMMDPRRHVQQQPQLQPLLPLPGTGPANNGSGFSSQNSDGLIGGVSVNRSRSDDQDSDQELYGMGGGSRGAPTNPKRKWKQEYEAEEAQGTTKRWAVSIDDEMSPGSYSMTGSGDKDERPLWGRSTGGGGVRR